MEENPEALPVVEYGEGFDKQRAFEMPFRGYVSGLIVVTPDGTRHPVYFTDLARLTQDFEADASNGETFFAERGTIILKEVTVANIENAVNSLWSQGWFNK